MDNVAAYVAAKYGSAHVFNPQTIAASFVITDTTAGGYANDAAAVTYGYYPLSALYDGVHLTQTVRRAIMNGRNLGNQVLPGLRASIEAVRRL